MNQPAAEASTIALLSRLFREHGRQHVGAYVAAALLLAVGAIATAISAYLLKPILNHMAEASGFGQLRLIAFGIAGLFIIRGLATYGSLVLLARTGNRIIAEVQTRLFDNLVWQNLGFFQDRHSTEFMAQLSLAANGVRDSLQLLVTSIGRDVLTVIGLVIVMVIQDPLMTLIALSVTPIGGFLLSRLIRRIRQQALRSLDGSTRIMQTMLEAVQGARIVKSFNLQNVMRARMAASVSEVERAANRVAASSAISSPLADALAGIAIGGVIFYGSWRVTIAHADPGSFFSFIGALLLAYEPAKRLARLNLDIQSGFASVRLIYGIIDQPAAERRRPDLPKLEVSEARIRFEAVSFSYRPGEPVLDGLDLDVEPSATTALVGASGGGKSTIVSLIQRFYDPQAGSIRIDGQDICAVDLESLRDQIAFVSQDVFLFRGSIRDNIALGRRGADEAAIIAAARKAHAHDFIQGFATGYDTGVGEHGAQLSGGQRQRIAIARAILKDARILLLDEPTAALDSDSEREVQRALDELRIGRTTLVVAHRLQTIINADRICVISEGRAVESGTHEELILRRGVYHRFFAAQFGDPGATVKLPT